MTAGERASYLAYRGAAWIALALPAPWAATAARATGLVLAQAMRGRRTMVARHLTRVHGPGLGRAQLRREVQRTFDSYARYWLEMFRLPALSPDDIERGLTHEGYQHLLDALDAGHGVILALPHLGNWDFGAAWLGRRGFGITAVAEPLRPTELFEWFADIRRGLGVDIVPLDAHAGTAVLRALGANRIVALVCDRDIGSGGVEVELFGERTTLPGGPATLGLRTGAPILPTAIYFDGAGHRAVVGAPLPAVREGRLRADVVRVTQLLAGELEALLRRAPEQWHLMQPNWPSDSEVGAKTAR